MVWIFFFLLNYRECFNRAFRQTVDKTLNSLHTQLIEGSVDSRPKFHYKDVPTVTRQLRSDD